MPRRTSVWPIDLNHLYACAGDSTVCSQGTRNVPAPSTPARRNAPSDRAHCSNCSDPAGCRSNHDRAERASQIVDDGSHVGVEISVDTEDHFTVQVARILPATSRPIRPSPRR